MCVTVIVVNWNSGELLAECLRHLHDQTVKPAEILVIDNASADDSASAASHFPNVKLYRHDKNLGFAAGNNYLLNLVSSEFVALLNPDAFPEPGWLEQLLACAEAHPDAAAFGSRQLCHENPEVLDGTGDVYHVSGMVWRARHGKRQNKGDLVARDIFSPCAAAALYRREALVKVGGFDEDYFCYVEDVDLGFRLRLAGYKALYVPGAVVRHVGSATTGGQRSDFAVYHGHRNLVWTYVKNMPGTLFWLLLPLHVLANLAVLILFALRGQGRVIFRAKWDALAALPGALKKRQRIQAVRLAATMEIWQIINKSLIPA